jgi:hypothetical protein
MAVERKNLADRVQAEIRQSVKQVNNLPNYLTLAPYAIYSLGKLRLLAFSHSALRIKLEKPEGGFIHLR